MPAGFAQDLANEKKITTVGVSYLPIPEVALKMDYQHVSNGLGASTDQVNIGMAYMY